jgi:integrase
VKVSPKVAAMLQRRIDGAQLGDYVFASKTGRPLHYSNFRDRSWLPILERARELGLTKKVTLHGLRHTQVGLLIENGANLPAIQRRIGHESIATTVNVYGRMVDDVPAETLDALDDALFGRQGLRVVGGDA